MPKRKVPGDHCWHRTGQTLTMDPPIAVERCCWCGKERRLPMEAHYGEEAGHGPFLGGYHIADSLAIARDGCAAYMGKEGTE